jgi:RimJ/RimL family protein N-acetyltransferase
MLEGALVRLEPLDPERDVTDDYVSWLADPAVFRFLGTKFGQTRASVRAYVERITPPNFIAKIVTREGELHVGNIAMQGFDPVHCTIELGILIGAAEARGKGYGREACRLAVTYAFDHLGVHKVTAGTVAPNVAMKKVFLSLGFAIEGTLRQQYLLEGARHDLLRFGLLRKELVAGRDQ